MTYIKPGDHNVICDRTGFKVKASDCRMEWNGLLVRKESWEPRQPQDFVQVPPDLQTVKNARPDTEPVFLGVNEVQPGDL